jgi:hypothetical protein
MGNSCETNQKHHLIEWSFHSLQALGQRLEVSQAVSQIHSFFCLWPQSGLHRLVVRQEHLTAQLGQ